VGSQWQPVSIAIELANGEVMEETCEYFAGHPRRPASDEQIDAKYLDLVAPHLGDSKATELLFLLRHLDRVDDLGEIVDRLRITPHP
jgi:hypothetical protein